MYVPLLWLLRDFPVFLDEYRLSCRELRQAIRRDTLEHIQKTADAAEDASTKTVVQRLRLLTGGPKRKSRDPPPLPAVELANGSLAATAEEAKARWLEHFSSIEDGHVKDPVTIVHDCYRRQAGKDLDAYSVSLQDVPDLCSLEGALRDTATDRAYGQDGIPGEVAHYCAAELSKALFQLHLNSIFRLCEPVQHKGGVLHCVWKKKGPKQQCTSYRGILRSRNSDTARRGSWFAVGLQAAYLSQVQIHSTTQVEATQYPNSDSPKWVPSFSSNARTLRIS